MDKVTGRANFGADMSLPGMLWAKIKRSPHAHARIVRIDGSRALALPGVRAVVSAADFPEIRSEEAFVGEGPMNFRDLSRMARDKVLYEGHAVAAVAAISPIIAAEALDLIEVQYDVLPHVIDVEAAMKPDTPLLASNQSRNGHPTSPSAWRFPKGTPRPASARPISLSHAAIRRSRCTRAISSRMRVSSRLRLTDKYRSGPAARASS